MPSTNPENEPRMIQQFQGDVIIFSLTLKTNGYGHI